MDQDKISKSKIALFNSMMNSPKLSRALNDAINSPVGSTKRAKAKAILSIVKKTNLDKIYTGGAKDGKGGVMDSLSYTPSGFNIQAPTVTAPVANVNTTPSNAGSTAQMFGDAWSELKNIGSDISNWAMVPPTKTVVFPKMPDIRKQMSTLGSADSSVSAVSKNISDTLRASIYGDKIVTPTVTMDKAISALKGISGASGVTPPAKATGPIAPVQPVIQTGTVGAPETTKVAGTPSITTINPADLAKYSNYFKGGISGTSGAAPKVDTTALSTGTKISASSTQKFSGPATGNVPGSTDLAQTGGTAMTLNDMRNNAQYYIDNNLGSEMYAQDTIKLIQGKTLAEQDAELKETLKADYNISALLAEKNKFADAAPTATQDMTDYVKGRDQFVSKINGLIAKTNERAMNMDMTNPANAQMIDTYKQYLSLLKGRQNQQYGTYINKSIDNLNNDIKRVDANYSNAVSLYNSALTSGEKNLTDNYNNAKKALTEMYDALESAPSKFYALSNQKFAYAKNQLETIGGSVKSDPWLPEVTAIKGTIWDSDGAILPDINLKGSLELLSGQGYDSNAVIFGTTMGMKKALEGATGDPIETSKLTKDYLSQFREAYGANVIDQDTYNAVGLPIINAGKDVISREGDSINSYILSNASNVTKALKNLDSKWNQYAEDKGLFLKNNSGVDSNILGAIYDTASVDKTQTPSSSILENINYAAKTDAALQAQPEKERLADYLSSMIVENKQNGWANEFK